MVIIYKTTNKINNKCYIGIHRTQNINDGYLGSGILLKKAINKYGTPSFTREILFEYNDCDENLAWAKERELVNKEFVLSNATYNLSIGGYKMPVLFGRHNPFYGKTHSKETIDKIKETRTKNDRWLLSEEHKVKIGLASSKMWQDENFKKRTIEKRIAMGRKLTEEHRKILSDYHKNKIVTDEARLNMSKAQRKRFDSMTKEEKLNWYNNTFTEERASKISESLKGRECPWVQITNKNPEKIEKMAEKHRGMKRTDEAKKNISESKKGKIAIHNIETKKYKFIDKNSFVPDGWAVGMK